MTIIVCEVQIRPITSRRLQQPASMNRRRMSTPQRVLLVDDSGNVREMYSEYLTLCGYLVVTAASGAEALKIAYRPERPTLILVNLHTRSMDGTTFVRSFRSEPAFADVPIIAFNAHDMPEAHDQALRDGFDAVISEPCLPEDLVTLMRPFLQADRDSDIQG